MRSLPHASTAAAESNGSSCIRISHVGGRRTISPVSPPAERLGDRRPHELVGLRLGGPSLGPGRELGQEEVRVEATRLRARCDDLREGYEGVEREAPAAVSQSLLERDALVEPPPQSLGLVARRPGPVPAGEQDSCLLDQLARGGDPAREPAGDIEVREARRRIEPVATRCRLDKDVGVVDCSAGEDVRSGHEGHRGAPPQEHHLERAGPRLPDHDDGGGRTGSRRFRHAASMHGDGRRGCRGDRDPDAHGRGGRMAASMHLALDSRSNYRPFCNRTPTCDSVSRRSSPVGRRNARLPGEPLFASKPGGTRCQLQ